MINCPACNKYVKYSVQNMGFALRKGADEPENIYRRLCEECNYIIDEYYMFPDIELENGGVFFENKEK